MVGKNVWPRICILWKSRARFSADMHKPYNLALEKKNGFEQENIFRAHYSSRSHREGARTQPVNGKQLALQGQRKLVPGTQTPGRKDSGVNIKVENQ